MVSSLFPDQSSGRALSDLERFIALLPFFCTRRYTDLPLLRKVVAFDSQQTVKSVDAYRRSSTLHLLQSAQLGLVGGSKRFYADSMKRGFESLCTFPTIINRHIINHAKYTSTPGPPTGWGFALCCLCFSVFARCCRRLMGIFFQIQSFLCSRLVTSLS